ncbi:MAG: hypothetical protein QG567_2284 [Campylobacterota bacterium]|nr:hypothetical protein [Campylobacterota bacterium]
MQNIPQPAFYMFMCSVERPPHFPKPSCVNAGTRDLFQHLSQILMQKGVINTVVPVQTGCLNRCSQGPIMIVEPGHFMYTGLNKEKVERIVDEHIIGGKVVSEYLINEFMWGEAISPVDMQKMSGVY